MRTPPTCPSANQPYCSREFVVQRSNADDTDEIAEPGEVVRVPGIEGKAIRVCGGGDQKVGDTPSV
jgi:hypothetical protein